LVADAEKTLAQAEQEAARLVDDARDRSQAARESAAQLEHETEARRAELLAAAQADASQLVAEAITRAQSIADHCSALLAAIRALAASVPVGEEG
jgi:vacuolar-type H+-ATPase subunit H